MGKASLSQDFRLRISDFDYKDHLLLSALLDFAQDVAGKHADTLNIGYSDLIAKDQIWMVIRHEIEFIEYPPLYETITVTTWPLPQGRIDCDRETLVISSKDPSKVYVKMSSKWIIASYSSRRILRLGDLYNDCDEPLRTDRNFLEPAKKLPEFEFINPKEGVVMPTILDLDHNGHINNAKYANFIYLAIPELHGQKMKHIQMDFDKELVKDVPIVIKYEQENNLFKIVAFQNNTKCFVAKISIE
jgi:acyl-ACP thioesterase